MYVQCWDDSILVAIKSDEKYDKGLGGCDELLFMVFPCSGELFIATFLVTINLFL